MDTKDILKIVKEKKEPELNLEKKKRGRPKKIIE